MNIRLIATCFGIFICTCCGQSAETLSDGDAKKIIEKGWNSDTLFVPLGQLTVIGGLGMAPDRQLDSRKREINRGGFMSMQIFEQMGVVVVKQAEDLTKRFTTWENWMAMTQNGVQVRLLATAGPNARNLQCEESQQSAAKSEYGDTNVLCITKGQATIEQIVQNDARTVGVDHYRAIFGTYVWILSPTMQEFYRRAGQVQKSERKFIAALKFDPFAHEWRVAALDIADRDANFTTQNVNGIFAQK